MAGTHPQDIPPFVEDNNPLTPQNPSTPVAPQDHPTIKAELDNSLPTSNIKAELDNSLPTLNSKAELDNSPPTLNIKAELDKSLPTSNIKAEFDNSSLTPQSSTSPVAPQRPNTTIYNHKN